MRIFVYGSLKRGYELHALIGDQAFLGEAVTRPFYRLFDLGTYPGLVDWPEGLAVQGEVYDVNSDCLTRLDQAEGVADALYARRQICLEEPFATEPVEAYFWLQEVRKLADCGTAWPRLASRPAARPAAPE